MSRLARALAALAMTTTVLLAAASPALAGPTTWSKVDVTVHADQGGATMMVGGRLPDDATLPADVELAVPAGAELLWAGEVLGGSPSADPSVSYTKATAGGSDVYRFRLTRARVGQVEVAAPGVQLSDGGGYRVSLTWTPSQDAPEARLAFRVPNAASISSAPAGAALIPVEGETYGYYAKTFKDAKAGKPLTLAFAYTAPAGSLPAAAAAGPSATSTAAGSDLLPFAAVMAIAGITAVALVAVRRRNQASDGATDEDEHTRTQADETAEEPGEAPEAPRAGMSARTRAMLVVASAAVIVAAVAAVSTSASSKWVNGTLTRTYAGVDACTTAEFPLTVQGDLERDAGKLLDSLHALTGLKSATITAAGPSIRVEFCDSTSSAEEIRATLSATGVATAGAPLASAPATEAAPTP